MTDQRLTARIAPGTVLRFIRRPVVDVPPEGTLAIVDNGDLNRTGTRSSAARFRDGKFRGVPFEPTYWMVIDD